MHAPCKYVNIQWEEHALEIDTFSPLHEQVLVLTCTFEDISSDELEVTSQGGLEDISSDELEEMNITFENISEDDLVI